MMVEWFEETTCCGVGNHSWQWQRFGRARDEREREGGRREREREACPSGKRRTGRAMTTVRMHRTAWTCEKPELGLGQSTVPGTVGPESEVQGPPAGPGPRSRPARPPSQVTQLAAESESRPRPPHSPRLVPGSRCRARAQFKIRPTYFWESHGADPAGPARRGNAKESS
jgi:hypothetical protein